MDLGCVNFDLEVVPSWPAAQPLIPKSHQPRQKWADFGTVKVSVTTAKTTSRCDTL